MAEDEGLTLNLPVDADGAEAQGMGLGAAISQKLTESIANIDLVNVLQKMVAQTPEDEQSEEIRDKLKGALAQFKDMTDEDKVEFTRKIKEGLTNKLSARLQDTQVFGNLEDAMRQAIMTKLYMVAAGVILLILLFVFFGYKLFKSIKDKEKKREEKKMAKQLKKKK